ncbi:hypothetical protein EYF80_038739 [Liparis tanakae]|uniref:Uncharacterized protein n=1 Tax=Liparis tanakae TaxID=230148 RepID=A0A4Z2GBU5_9TELE|nr:hypothetical protein EYF80_038739 [Liparis tanakae]
MRSVSPDSVPEAPSSCGTHPGSPKKDLQSRELPLPPSYSCSISTSSSVSISSGPSRSAGWMSARAEKPPQTRLPVQDRQTSTSPPRGSPPGRSTCMLVRPLDVQPGSIYTGSLPSTTCATSHPSSPVIQFPPGCPPDFVYSPGPLLCPLPPPPAPHLSPLPPPPAPHLSLLFSPPPSNLFLLFSTPTSDLSPLFSVLHPTCFSLKKAKWGYIRIRERQAGEAGGCDGDTG